MKLKFPQSYLQFPLLTDFVEIALPVDRKLLSQPFPTPGGRLNLRALLPSFAYALGSGVCLTVLAALTESETCGMVFFLLSQFLYACGCLWPEGAFRRKRFGYRLFWVLFPVLALPTLALVALPGLNTALGFSLPTFRDALLAVGLAAGWQLCVQLFLLALSNRKKKKR